MKRIALMCVGLALVAAPAARAQTSLTMMGANGWAFKFSGNVNAFYFYSQTNAGTVGGATTTKVGQTSSFGTGLLPSFAVFEAMGKEGGLDLGVHFGFAPQVNYGGNLSSFFGSQAAGAQIDMRQVYITVGGDWGEITMGKNLGLFQRQNLLTDMTLFGAGPGGGGRGTAAGRIGFGYLYTDFRPQITYSTKAGEPFNFAIGIFEPIDQAQFTVVDIPRLESEIQYNGKFSSGGYKFFASGAIQSVSNSLGATSQRLTSGGVAGGFNVNASGFALTASGFYSSGHASQFLGDLFSGNGIAASDGVSLPDAAGNRGGRTTYGYIGQVTYTPSGSKVTLGASYGANRLQLTDADKLPANIAALNTQAPLYERNSITGMFTYQVTKSYRIVLDGTYSTATANTGTVATQNGATGAPNSNTFQAAAGMMLFF